MCDISCFDCLIDGGYCFSSLGKSSFGCFSGCIRKISESVLSLSDSSFDSFRNCGNSCFHSLYCLCTREKRIKLRKHCITIRYSSEELLKFSSSMCSIRKDLISLRREDLCIVCTECFLLFWGEDISLHHLSIESRECLRKWYRWSWCLTRSKWRRHRRKGYLFFWRKSWSGATLI